MPLVHVSRVFHLLFISHIFMITETFHPTQGLFTGYIANIMWTVCCDRLENSSRMHIVSFYHDRFLVLFISCFFSFSFKFTLLSSSQKEQDGNWRKIIMMTRTPYTQPGFLVNGKIIAWLKFLYRHCGVSWGK